MEKWQRLKRPFTDIQEATKNFLKCIGVGGFGPVYGGELTIDGKVTKVAVKRLNEEFGQGLTQFLTEIASLSGQSHKNLISLIGYCDEGKEKIIVYEYAARGSLDGYIRKPSSNHSDNNRTPLTWLQRLKICVDVARGLDYLHNHVGNIIHCDIKSANILLDENWVAKISDLGLSKLIPAYRSVVISNPCGTHGYLEPEYLKTGIVKKESDVYSFGMVLFEVLCGRLCYELDDDGFSLASKVKEFYENGKLASIIDPSLRNQMNNASMEKYSTIAYRCLQDREQRPSIDMVLRELKESLNLEDKSILLGPWGGNGGVHWDDGVHSGVREITIVYGLCIDSIRVTYDNNGKPFPAEKHGGDGGNISEHIKLNFPEEILISVSGHYFLVDYGGHTVIRSLTFESNQRTYGPFGVEEGAPFNFLANGVHIVGLHGSSGWFLDSLGFCLATNKRSHLQRDQMISKRFTSVRPPLQGTQGAPNTLERLDRKMELLVYHHLRYQPFLERLAQRESQVAKIDLAEYDPPPQVDLAHDMGVASGDRDVVIASGAVDAINFDNERDTGDDDDAREQVDIGTNEMINLQSN